MTSYCIRLGYNTSHSKEEAEDRLLDVVMSIRHSPKRIIEEAARVEEIELDPSYAESYGTGDESRTEDSTLCLVYVEDDEEKELFIHMSASAANEQKYAARRAFCRLVIEDMHKVGMEVCLSVG